MDATVKLRLSRLVAARSRQVTLRTGPGIDVSGTPSYGLGTRRSVMRDRWLYAWALGSVAFGGASLLVPLYLVELGASPVDLGLLAATAAVGGAPGAIIFGRLADHVGYRRRLVIVTLATVSVTLAVIPVLTRIGLVIVANAVLWLVVASVVPVLTMLVLDEVPEDRWASRIGRLNTYQGYGWVGGLVLGVLWLLVVPAVVTDTPIRALFWVLAACVAASTIAAARLLPRSTTAHHVTSTRRIRKIAQMLASSSRGVKASTFPFTPNRLYWSTRRFESDRVRERLTPALASYLVAAALFFTGFAAFWAPLPLFLTDAGFGAGRVFALYLLSSSASAVLYERIGDVAARYDVRRLQATALAVRGLLFPAVGVVVGAAGTTLDLGMAGLGLAAIGVSWAVIAVLGTVIVTQLAPPTIRGEALGLHTAIGAVSGGLGSFLGGWLASIGYVVAFSVAGALVLLGAGIVISLRLDPESTWSTQGAQVSPGENR